MCALLLLLHVVLPDPILQNTIMNRAGRVSIRVMLDPILFDLASFISITIQL